MPGMLPRHAPALVFLSGLALACTTTTTGTGQPSSSSSSSTSGGGSGSLVTGEECLRRCRIKAIACSVPASDLDGVCANLCNGSYSTEQLTCMESKSCAQLRTTASLATLCPPGSSTSSTSSSSSSGDLGSTCGDSFDCSGTANCPCKDGPRPALLECVGTQCAPDCELVCELHGGT